MKELKELADIYLGEFDIHVKQHLTFAQIQKIINEVLTVDNFEERESTIDYFILCYCTDIPQETIDELGPDIFMESGLIDAVKDSIKNYGKLEEGISYHESTGKALRDIAKRIPDDWNELMKNVVHD